MSASNRKLTAIMFTDIVGFSAISSSDAEKTLEFISIQREALQPIVAQHEGLWLRETGDGLLLTFPSVINAVRCAVAMQQAVASIEGLQLRIGLHQGEVVEKDGDIYGDAVNTAVGRAV